MPHGRQHNIRFPRRGAAAASPAQIPGPLGRSGEDAQSFRDAEGVLRQVGGLIQAGERREQQRRAELEGISKRLTDEQLKIDRVEQATEVQEILGDFEADANAQAVDMQNMTREELADVAGHLGRLEERRAGAVDGASSDLVRNQVELELAKKGMPVARQAIVERAQDLTRASIIADSGQRMAELNDQATIGFDSESGEVTGNADGIFESIQTILGTVADLSRGTPEQKAANKANRISQAREIYYDGLYDTLVRTDPLQAANLYASGAMEGKMSSAALTAAKTKEQALRSRAINKEVSDAQAAMPMALGDYPQGGGSGDPRFLRDTGGFLDRAARIQSLSDTIRASGLPDDHPTVVSATRAGRKMAVQLGVAVDNYAEGIRMFQDNTPDMQTRANIERADIIAQTEIIPSADRLLGATDNETLALRSEALLLGSLPFGWVPPSIGKKLAGNPPLYVAFLLEMRKHAQTSTLDPKMDFSGFAGSEAHRIAHKAVTLIEEGRENLSIPDAVVLASREEKGLGSAERAEAERGRLLRGEWLKDEALKTQAFTALGEQLIALGGGDPGIMAQWFGYGINKAEEITAEITPLPARMISEVVSSINSHGLLNGGNLQAAAGQAADNLWSRGWRVTRMGGGPPTWKFRPPDLLLSDTTTMGIRGERVWWQEQLDNVLAEAGVLTMAQLSETGKETLATERGEVSAITAPRSYSLNHATTVGGGNAWQVTFSDGRVVFDRFGEDILFEADRAEFMRQKLGAKVTPTFLDRVRDPVSIQRLSTFRDPGLSQSASLEGIIEGGGDSFTVADYRTLRLELVRRLEVQNFSGGGFFKGEDEALDLIDLAIDGQETLERRALTTGLGDEGPP